jgi:AcrR family transcriptional regulator
MVHAPVRRIDSSLPRKAARDIRRAQLIDATIFALARKGYAALTLSDVAKEAGLSTGIVIFHFSSKDGLLEAVLSALAAEYHQNWEAQLRAAGPSPSARLKAMLLADFDTAIFTPEKLAAWVAFWGEAQGRPVHDQICAPYDAERRRVLEGLCQQLIIEGGYDVDVYLTGRTLEALCDGLWLGLASYGAGLKERVSASEAHKIVASALACLFPRHFSQRS